MGEWIFVLKKVFVDMGDFWPYHVCYVHNRLSLSADFKNPEDRELGRASVTQSVSEKRSHVMGMRRTVWRRSGATFSRNMGGAVLVA